MKTTENLAVIEQQEAPTATNGHGAMPDKPESKYIRFAELPKLFQEKGLTVSYDDLYAFVQRHNRRNPEKRIRLPRLPDRGGKQIIREDADLIFDMYINPEKYID